MNCLDFHRIINTTPDCDEADFLVHKRECAECASVAARWAELERALKEAVRVEVPENLADRILLKQSFLARRQRSRWRGIGLAVAASLLIAIGIGLGTLVETEKNTELAEEFVTLINNAPYAMTASGPVSSDDIDAALKPIGVALQGEIGEVTFASRCLVRGLLSGHIVLRGEGSKVTVFLVPDSLVTERARIASEHFTGIVLPDERGTIAIVGAPGESLNGIEHKVRSAVRWPA